MLVDAESEVFVDGFVWSKEEKMKIESEILAKTLGGCQNQSQDEKLEKREISGALEIKCSSQTLTLWCSWNRTFK